MKIASTLLVIPAAIVAIAAYASPQQGQSCGGCGMAMQHDDHHPAKPVQAKQLKDKQTATIKVESGYSPAAIEVKQGKPVELTFTAGKNPGCASTIVFKTLKSTSECPAGKSVTVKFTPKAKGEIPFTCGMGMYKGKVIVK